MRRGAIQLLFGANGDQEEHARITMQEISLKYCTHWQVRFPAAETPTHSAAKVELIRAIETNGRPIADTPPVPQLKELKNRRAT